MSSSPEKLLWLVSGSTYELDNANVLSPIGHSGRWISDEINSIRNDNIDVIVLPVKSLRSYYKLLFLDLSSTKVRIQGIEFFFSFIAYLLVRRRSLQVEFDLQGFPQDIAKNYFVGNWMTVSSFCRYPFHAWRDIVKWGRYYLRGLLACYMLKQRVSFRGRTDYDRSKIKEPLKYIRNERLIRNISFSESLHFRDQVILIPQVHYPTKGLHLILDDLEKYSDRVDLRIFLGGVKPKGYYGVFLAMRLASLKNVLKIEYVTDTRHSYDDILNCCDIVVLPSVVENSSNSLKEARSLGKIILVQESGGNLEMIKDYPKGYSYCYKNNGQFIGVLNEIFG